MIRFSYIFLKEVAMSQNVVLKFNILEQFSPPHPPKCNHLSVFSIVAFLREWAAPFASFFVRHFVLFYYLFTLLSFIRACFVNGTVVQSGAQRMFGGGEALPHRHWCCLLNKYSSPMPMYKNDVWKNVLQMLGTASVIAMLWIAEFSVLLLLLNLMSIGCCSGILRVHTLRAKSAGKYSCVLRKKCFPNAQNCKREPKKKIDIDNWF